MNGVSLLLMLLSWSVVYSWRTGVDQQQEYVLQIEPEVVQALATGEEIFSDVPPEAGTFQRLCIIVLPKDGAPARHTAASEEQFRQLLVSSARYASRDRNQLTADAPPAIVWPNRAGGSPEQTFGVTTGWQPDASGNQQYIVQIDPTVLSTLSLGDELYVPVDPAAGRMARFVVKTGREPLPKLGGLQPVGGQTAQTQPPLGPARSRFTNVGDTTTPAWNNSPAGFDSRGGQVTLPSPPSSYGQAPLPNANTYPTYNQAPATAGTNPDPYRTALPPAGEPLSPPGGYGVQPAANQQPQFPPANRPFNPPFQETRVAGLPPTSTAGQASPFNPNVGQVGTVQPQQEKPWGPLLFVTFALFFSIGGNLYLAYTALEFHSRYRNAIERLRSAARSS